MRTSPLSIFFSASLGLALLGACSDEPQGGGSGGATASSSSNSSSSAMSVGGAGGTGGSGGSGGTPGAGGSAGNGGAGGSGGDPFSNLSDTFDGNMLDPAWHVYRPEVLDIAVGSGALSLTLTQQALWFNNSRGPLVYKLVSGDFKVTAHIRARKNSSPQEAPASAVHLGGLMARDPAGEAPGAAENYVFVVVGYDENDISVETKSTTNSVSQYVGPTWPSSDAELRLCRVGSTFRLYKRPISGGAFTLAQTYERPDLPGELQVGANIYSLNAPDLKVSFDEIVFEKASSEADCAAD